MTMSAARVSSAGVAAALAPAATTGASLSWLRFQTLSRYPAASRRRHMGRPMSPRPMNPRLSLLLIDSSGLANSCGTASLSAIAADDVGIGLDAEPGRARHRQLAAMRLQRRSVQRGVRPKIEVLEARLRREGGEQMQRRERAGPEVRRMRRELHAPIAHQRGNL